VYFIVSEKDGVLGHTAKKRAGWDMGFIPTHAAMKLRHEWGTRSLVLVRAKMQAPFDFAQGGLFDSAPVGRFAQDDKT
jgi:hypothetical protein